MPEETWTSQISHIALYIAVIVFLFKQVRTSFEIHVNLKISDTFVDKKIRPLFKFHKYSLSSLVIA